MEREATSWRDCRRAFRDALANRSVVCFGWLRIPHTNRRGLKPPLDITSFISARHHATRKTHMATVEPSTSY